MSQQQWTEVDRYFTELFVPYEPALDGALQAATNAGLPEIQVTPNQGKLLYLLARAHNVRSILEIGTLGGYSTIWLARALPSDGQLISLELDSKHASIARSNLDNAGLSAVAEIRLGAALTSLPQLAADGAGPFDLVFIDADKVNTPQYLEWALRLTKPGSLIIIDNVVRDGKVSDIETKDENVRGIQQALKALAENRHLVTTAIQTVGSKGYDGFSITLVTARSTSM